MAEEHARAEPFISYQEVKKRKRESRVSLSSSRAHLNDQKTSHQPLPLECPPPNSPRSWELSL
jgi:hypothetical protein